jgi:hypothetical protein
MKAYLYGGLFVVFCLVMAGVYYLGGQGEREERAKEAARHAQAETLLLEKVQKAKQEREVVYRDKIKIVEKASDSCLDSNLSDDVRMQLSGGAKAK